MAPFVLVFALFFLSRSSFAVTLKEVASGFEQVTDIQFFPDQKQVLVVAQKTGKVSWKDLSSGESGLILELKVRTSSEMGLLGLAFHPQFKINRRIFINYNPEGGSPRTRISEFKLKGQALKAQQEKIVLEVDQPFANHDAGQLQFGPDGFLYIGMGDGGSGGDPQGHGQNPETLLGSMLRIDIDQTSNSKPYAIPADNPGLQGKKSNGKLWLPEIFAIGLRNPWRFSFDPQTGNLIVADVGQNAYEEVTIVKKGENHGWNAMEGTHCYPPSQEKCRRQDFILPVIEYPHRLGSSITGGYVYSGSEVPHLKGYYLFADFVSGRLWKGQLRGKGMSSFVELGRWQKAFSSFGKDPSGELYLGAFDEGKIYKISR